MDLIKPTRRGFLLGLLAAPVIVKAASLMPIKPMRDVVTFTSLGTWQMPDCIPVSPTFYKIYMEVLAENKRLGDRLNEGLYA